MQIGIRLQFNQLIIAQNRAGDNTIFRKRAGEFSRVERGRKVGGIQTGFFVVYFVKSAEYGACFLVVSRGVRPAIT